jgi:Protein of unknown function (DUF4065)
MQFDRAKLKDTILYACSRCEPSRLGAVKLHKVLYFTDMLHYASIGSPLTGATYRKRPMGPTCDQLLRALSELVRDSSLRINDVEYFGYLKKEYIVADSNRVDSLTAADRALIDEIVEFVCVNNTAKTISEFSHNRAWEAAEFGDVLPYYSVFHIFPTQVSLEAWEWALGEADEIEAERSQSDPMGYDTLADFRTRLHAERRQ